MQDFQKCQGSKGTACCADGGEEILLRSLQQSEFPVELELTADWEARGRPSATSGSFSGPRAHDPATPTDALHLPLTASSAVE